MRVRIDTTITLLSTCVLLKKGIAGGVRCEHKHSRPEINRSRDTSSVVQTLNEVICELAGGGGARILY